MVVPDLEGCGSSQPWNPNLGRHTLLRAGKATIAQRGAEGPDPRSRSNL